MKPKQSKSKYILVSNCFLSKGEQSIADIYAVAEINAI